MRKKLWSVTLAALAIAVVLTFGACSQEGPVDTGSTYMPAIMVHGYVYIDGTSTPITGALVWWHRTIDPPSVQIGTDYTDRDGYYAITGSEQTWGFYQGYSLSGHASHEDYEDGDAEDIDNFDLNDIPYERDIYLVPE